MPPPRGAAAIVEVVPEVAADRVDARGLLDAVDVVRQRVVEQPRERVDRGEIGRRLARARVRIPEPIDEAEARVQIERDREAARANSSCSTKLDERGAPRAPSARRPRPCTRAAAATMRWPPSSGVPPRRRAAGALRMRSTPLPFARVPRAMPTGLTSGTTTMRQRASASWSTLVPREPRDERGEIGDRDVGADPLEAVHAAGDEQAGARAARAERWRRTGTRGRGPGRSRATSTRASGSSAARRASRSIAASSGSWLGGHARGARRARDSRSPRARRATRSRPRRGRRRITEAPARERQPASGAIEHRDAERADARDLPRAAASPRATSAGTAASAASTRERVGVGDPHGVARGGAVDRAIQRTARGERLGGDPATRGAPAPRGCRAATRGHRSRRRRRLRDHDVHRASTASPSNEEVRGEVRREVGVVERRARPRRRRRRAGRARRARAPARSASREVSPPGTGVPVPGANAGIDRVDIERDVDRARADPLAQLGAHAGDAALVDVVGDHDAAPWRARDDVVARRCRDGPRTPI